MQIVIDIPKSLHSYIKNQIEPNREAEDMLNVLINSVYDGTLLSEDHGDLIDADDLEHITVCCKTRNSGITRIDAPTIIEADTESEDQV